MSGALLLSPVCSQCLKAVGWKAEAKAFYCAPCDRYFDDEEDAADGDYAPEQSDEEGCSDCDCDGDDGDDSE